MAMNGWHTLAVNPVPNDVFDALAKYYDAGLDRFLYRRFTDCVIVNDQIFTAILPEGVSLAKAGYRVTHWCEIPKLPDDVADAVR